VLPHIRVAGLDPAIDDDAPFAMTVRLESGELFMDLRVKPGVTEQGIVTK
jgi:hypothetical protein